MKADAVKIAKTDLDDRRKFTDAEKEDIKEHKLSTGQSYKKVAELFDCSPSEVYYICNPDKYKEKVDKESRRGTFRTKEQKRVTAQKTRDKKRLYLKQQLQNKKQ